MTDDRESQLTPGILIAGFFAMGVSTWQLVVMYLTSANPQTDPATSPPLLPGFHWLLISLLLNGVCTVSVVLLKNNNRLQSAEWYLLPATAMIVWILFYGVLLLVDKAMGQGGLVWGVWHTLTLDRFFTGGSSAGSAGYRIGQLLALGIWCLYPLTLLAASNSPTDEPKESPEPG